MQINCPFCGKRSLSEFHQSGDASKIRPPLDNGTMADWLDFIYLRENIKGVHREYWQHNGGCGAWLIVTRDTVSHDVLNVALASSRLGPDVGAHCHD